MPVKCMYVYLFSKNCTREFGFCVLNTLAVCYQKYCKNVVFYAEGKSIAFRIGILRKKFQIQEIVQCTTKTPFIDLKMT